MEQISQLKRRKKLGKIQSGGRYRKRQSDRSGENEEKRSGALRLRQVLV